MIIQCPRARRKALDKSRKSRDRTHCTFNNRSLLCDKNNNALRRKKVITKNAFKHQAVLPTINPETFLILSLHWERFRWCKTIRNRKSFTFDIIAKDWRDRVVLSICFASRGISAGEDGTAIDCHSLIKDSYSPVYSEKCSRRKAGYHVRARRTNVRRSGHSRHTVPANLQGCS